MRLFVAAEIDPALARELARVAGELRERVVACAPRARLTWVPADRLHFTVRFILEFVQAAFTAAVAKGFPFDPCHFGQAFTFPEWQLTHQLLSHRKYNRLHFRRQLNVKTFRCNCGQHISCFGTSQFALRR